MMRHVKLFLLAATFLATATGAQPQMSTGDWAASLSDRYLVYPDRVYGTAAGVPLKLDVWQAQAKEPVPTVVYIHGGGWFFGDRTGAVPYMMPWIERGWSVVNAEYRMSPTSLAPAAVEDARCALRWVYRNAKEFHLDTSRIIVTGHSAGGHLALMMGMLQESDGLDSNCPSDPSLDVPIKVAAVVNFYGPADVADLLDGPNRKTYAVSWLGSQMDRLAIAKRVSPLTYVRPGLPPILTIHGDADSVVPYSGSVRLHDALTKTHVPNELYTVHGGDHGQFGVETDIANYRKVWEFLEANVPSLPRRDAKSGK